MIKFELTHNVLDDETLANLSQDGRLIADQAKQLAEKIGNYFFSNATPQEKAAVNSAHIKYFAAAIGPTASDGADMAMLIGEIADTMAGAHADFVNSLDSFIKDGPPDTDRSTN